MSGPEISQTKSELAKDEAADWLWRQQSANWTEADQATLDEWLSRSRHHLVAYWRLKAAWDRAERLAALRPSRMGPTVAPTPSRRWAKIRLTAAICAVAAIAAIGVYRSTDRVDHYETAVGQRATIKLADGSQVELNTNSAISVDVGMLRRTVELSKGEAFFKIRHDATRPFTVLAAGHRITDLGTAFAVRTSGHQIEVTLVEGRARLETASKGAQHHAADLTPGEIAVATAETLSVSRMPSRTIDNALAWRQGKLIFRHVTLAEAAAEFNRYNKTKLIVEPTAADLKVSGTFEAGSIGPFTAMAKLAFGLRIERQNNEITVSRAVKHSIERND